MPPHVAAAHDEYLGLIERIRSLYEDTVVPVREIARLVDRTERVIYKYAHRFGWKPRAAVLPRGDRGRFMPLTDARASTSRGRKPRAPGTAAAAARRCVRAGLITRRAASAAVAETRARAVEAETRAARSQRLRDIERIARALGHLARTLKSLRAIDKRAAHRGAQPPEPDVSHEELGRRILAKLDAFEAETAAEEAGAGSPEPASRRGDGESE